MFMQEPGLDRHEWETAFEALEEDLHTDPYQALPELADLVEQMLAEAGYDFDDPVAREGEEREVVAEYLAACEVSNLIETGNTQLSPGDVAAAIDGLRALAAHVLAEDIDLS